MNRQYAYTPYLWLALSNFLFLLLLAGYCWRRRTVPGAIPLMIGCLLGAAIFAGSALEHMAVAEATKLFWYKVQAVLMLPVVTALFCFLLEYAWPGRWLSRRNLILLAIVPVISAFLVLTNDLHHLLWRSMYVNGAVLVEYGLIGWLNLVYSFFILGGISLVVFGWLFLHSPQQRWPIALMVAGQLGGHLGYVLARTQGPATNQPIALLAMSFEFLMYALAFFGFGILDPIPLARNMAIEQLHAGILVLDPQGRIVSSNPAAEQIFAAPPGRLKGQLVNELLPACADRLSSAGDGADQEIVIHPGQASHHYTLAVSQLNDWRGLDIGRLLMLQDITEQRRNQAMLLEQQRVVATLSERERLARELHDSLGQALAAAHLQASTARQLYARGEAAQVGEYLELLTDTTLQAEADMREFLLGAPSIGSADHAFFPSLREYLERFTRQYRLPVALSLPPDVEEQDLPQTVAIQLLRIIQEALSNVRKHAGSAGAWLTFSISGGMLQAAICDEGQGFEPASRSGSLANGFGLHSMRERAESLGGSLAVISHPGRGTQVVVRVPLTGEKAPDLPVLAMSR